MGLEQKGWLRLSKLWCQFLGHRFAFKKKWDVELYVCRPGCFPQGDPRRINSCTFTTSSYQSHLTPCRVWGRILRARRCLFCLGVHVPAWWLNQPISNILFELEQFPMFRGENKKTIETTTQVLSHYGPFRTMQEGCKKILLSPSRSTTLKKNRWSSFWMIINPLLKTWWFVNQAIKNGGWISREILVIPIFKVGHWLSEFFV